MARAKDILFRIFYSTSYTFVFFVTIAFICASPADTLVQSYRRRRLIDIAFIAGAYVLTGLVAILIYASRIYTNRSVINAIPKTYMPIDKDELPRKRIWHYISDILLKSAVVAYQAEPRSKKIEQEIPEAKERILAALHPKDDKSVQVTRFEPKWGIIEHRGWSSPAKDNLANLQYETVVAELIDLVEAKAVSLASIHAESTSIKHKNPNTNDELVSMLARPENIGMRPYLSRLIELGVIDDTALATIFLTEYERARFAPRPLSESDFHSLMRIFAELLRSLKSIDQTDVNVEQIPFDGTNQHSAGTSETKLRNANMLSQSQSSLSISDFEYNSTMPPARVSEDSVPSQATDETGLDRKDSMSFRPAFALTPRAELRRASRSNSGTVTGTRNGSTRRPSLRQQRSQASGLSSLSGRSSKSSRSQRSTLSNTGSVIVRLTRDDEDAVLPYTIEMPPSTRTGEN